MLADSYLQYCSPESFQCCIIIFIMNSEVPQVHTYWLVNYSQSWQLSILAKWPFTYIMLMDTLNMVFNCPGIPWTVTNYFEGLSRDPGITCSYQRDSYSL